MSKFYHSPSLLCVFCAFCGFLFISLFACKTPQESQKPNILIFLADDLGYGDLGCYGGTAQTPHLDALASKGVRFTNCYAGAPNCSPSRVSLLTGRIPARTGMYSYRPPGSPMHLKGEEVTMAEMLKAHGYQTAHFGKWHLGELPQRNGLLHAQPDEQGFDYSIGTQNNSQPSHLNPTNFVRNGVKIGETEGYACQLVANEAENWFQDHYQNDQPFFMYVPFHEPHAKIASPPEMVAHYPAHKKRDAEYFANIENMDSAAGRIMNMLEARGLSANTMIIFLSDNGSYRMGSNGNLRGLKGEIYDGGMKVPGIFTFPGKFPSGRTDDTPIWFQDVMPTVASLTGATLPNTRPLDGIDLLDHLRGTGAIGRSQAMLWYFYRSSSELSMRKGNYSLIGRVHDTIPRTHWIADKDMSFIKTLYPNFWELYDLSTDPGQRHDLASEQPEKLKEMQGAFETLFKEVQAEGPVWVDLPAYSLEKANHDKVGEYERNRKRFLK